jgi:uncharacterized GH25 family protein
MSCTMNSTMPRARRARRIATVTAGLLLLSAVAAAAHDMFVQPARFFAEENANVLVRVLNGTFAKSENSIDRARLVDVTVVSPGGRQRVDTAAWSTGGDTSAFTIRTGAAGTYVVGVSTRPNVIALEAKEFNQYLSEDGIPDVLVTRRRSGELGRPARERYSKHVKALIQVGSARSDHFATELGYPAEVLALDNPYELHAGGSLRVRALVDGKPAANQYVLFGGRTPGGERLAQRSLRSNADGIARIPLRTRGTWYVKFINMARLEGDSAADYESKWATLTFQVR